MYIISHTLHDWKLDNWRVPMVNSLNIAPISHNICFIELFVAFLWWLFLKAITQKAKRSGNFSSYRNILQSFFMKKKDHDVRIV